MNNNLQKEQKIIKANHKKCPKCGFELDIKAEECPKCGVIIKKLVSEDGKRTSNNNTIKKHPESVPFKHSPWVYIARWILGATTLLAGLIAVLNSEIFMSVILLGASIVLMPSIYHMMRPHQDFDLGVIAKTYLIVLGIVCILLGLGAFAVSKILPGMICILFGILIFPDIYQLLSNETKYLAGAGCVIVVIIGAWIAVDYGLMDVKNKKNPVAIYSWKEKDNSTMAYIMMKNYVKQRLKTPNSAEFPGLIDGRENHVRYVGEQKYEIKSWVDSQNSLGVKIRTPFIGQIEQVAKDRWSLISLNFIQ